MSILAATALGASAAFRFAQAHFLGHGDKYAIAAVTLLAAAASVKDARSQDAVPKSR
jgi:branched-subunit amino acid ABC-type transport system permease component